MDTRESVDKEERDSDQEVFSKPIGKNKERKERGKYKKTLGKERLWAKSVSSIEGFVKRKREERGSSEDKEDVRSGVKNQKMLRSPQQKRSLDRVASVNDDGSNGDI